jgi:translation initiation factor 3 subunit E
MCCVDGNLTDLSDFAALREQATSRYQTLQHAAQPVNQDIEDPLAVERLRANTDMEKNIQLLRSDYNVSFFIS